MESKPTKDIKFAIFNGTEEITDEMYQEVLAFMEHIHTNAPENKKTPQHKPER